MQTSQGPLEHDIRTASTALSGRVGLQLGEGLRGTPEHVWQLDVDGLPRDFSPC